MFSVRCYWTDLSQVCWLRSTATTSSGRRGCRTYSPPPRSWRWWWSCWRECGSWWAVTTPTFANPSRAPTRNPATSPSPSTPASSHTQDGKNVILFFNFIHLSVDFKVSFSVTYLYTLLLKVIIQSRSNKYTSLMVFKLLFWVILIETLPNLAVLNASVSTFLLYIRR